MNTYTKICGNCKITKSTTEFSKDKYRKDGHDWRCKSCKKEFRENNKESIAEFKRKWRKNNRELINQYEKNKKVTEPLHRLSVDIRNLVGAGIRKNGYTKKSRTHEILGCSWEEFHAHIENQFMEGMSWDNRSEWHLDHITPVSWGTTEEEIIALNHYTNFQPLWAIDNIRKGNRFSGR